jgi:hypothetical protein
MKKKFDPDAILGVMSVPEPIFTLAAAGRGNGSG